jgi:excisionase family DNA binding protein
MADWITVSQARELTGYNAEYLRQLIRAGEIKAQKFGTLWQVDRKSLLAYRRNAEKQARNDKRYGSDSGSES